MRFGTFKYILPVLALGVAATSAFADCEEDQEDMVGKAVAAAASAKVAALIPGAGKQMVNLETCDVGSGGFTTTFKFNVIGADGLYWVQGKAKVVSKNVTDLTIAQVSPNLASAASAKGVKLASN
jgi:hypothetical protein